MDSRKIILASPRSHCAGVERAIGIVERALELYGVPVYVRKEIVHNRQVVVELEERGAIFVDSESEVPEEAVCIFSAHGVSPEVRRNAESRGLKVIDATCPLVAKVHAEARKFARSGRRILLIGHEEHEEIEGTVGEAPENTVVIRSADEIDAAGLDSDEPVAYLTQTTLSVDDTSRIVEELRGRFNDMAEPSGSDICYATQNRQAAVKEIAREADLVLVVGAANSSNSNRLVEVARSGGTPAYLIPDETQLNLAWLEGRDVIGVSSGASAPEVLVDGLLERLANLGYRSVETREVVAEDLTFSLPSQLRELGSLHELV